MRFLPLKLAALSAALLTSAAGFAHAALVASTPGVDATIASTNKIELHFNEKLVSKFSGVELVMTGMPGMADHPPMRIAVASKVAGDGKTMVATTKKPLPAGSYKINWHAVAGDSHRMTGGYSFKVQ